MTVDFGIRIRCSCGDVEVLVEGQPVARAYCHCSSCRALYELPVLSATAWNKEALRVVAGQHLLGEYRPPGKQMARHFCRNCGTTVFGSNRLDLRVIRTSLLARSFPGGLPQALSPAFHLFYDDREISISDDLPKYRQGWDGPLHIEQDRQVGRGSTPAQPAAGIAR